VVSRLLLKKRSTYIYFTTKANCGIGPTSGTSSAASSVALKEKEIVKVSEIEDCLKNGKAIFTHD
jgi:hypothetical protein